MEKGKIKFYVIQHLLFISLSQVGKQLCFVEVKAFQSLTKAPIMMFNLEKSVYTVLQHCLCLLLPLAFSNSSHRMD